MRFLAASCVLIASNLGAQQARLTQADSGLVARILTAEDRRDTTATAIAEGLRHRDGRIQLIARRAQARIRDPKFAARDSLPPVAAPPKYADPAWRLRYRALSAKPAPCDLISWALTDSVWAVRLHAVDVAPKECANDELLTVLRNWVHDETAGNHRKSGEVSWHARAHGLTALARLFPVEARRELPNVVRSPIPWLRTYAAHAAATLADTATLLRLAHDPNDNVKEAAIDELAKTAHHATDSAYVQALSSSGYQVVRAAGRALAGSPKPELATQALKQAAANLRRGSSETSIDARTALAERLREFGVQLAPSTLITPPAPLPLPREAVALALGKDVRLRVTLADSSGGGSFVVRLRGDVAPIMAARVLELVHSGWYDNRTWYRVEPDFVIQGGGPGSNEYVGHPRFMRDELSSLPQVRGTVGMSTRGHDTGDAQWFINLRDNQRLTRDYTAFGEIVEGIDVVDGILEGDVIKRIEVIGATPKY
jgi:cyclophilin family peptidyl-prolyl cis-trans isomerase